MEQSLCGPQDQFCQRDGFTATPWMCHDVTEFASALMRVMVDGELVAQSPVLRIQEVRTLNQLVPSHSDMHVSLRQGEWAFDVPFGPGASIMRLEVVRGPVAQGGKTPSGGYVVNQDAYDLVDLVEAGFVSEAWEGTALPPDHGHEHVH